MLDCFSSNFRQSESRGSELRRLTSQDFSAGTTPRSNVLSSPNINLIFKNLTQTPSILDIQTKISDIEECENGDVTHYLVKVIEPNPEHVQNALSLASSNPLTNHLSPYFTHTEQVCHLLLKLQRWARRTRNHYQPIIFLNQNLPTKPESLNQEQCDSVSETLKHFRTKEIANPCSGSHSLNNMDTYSRNLKEHVNGSLVNNSKPVSCTSIRFLSSAMKLSMAALSALFTGSPFSTVPKLSKKDLDYIRLLENAARRAYALHIEVQTIKQLVKSIHTCVESDRSYVDFYTSRGLECYSMIEVVKGVDKRFEKTSKMLVELEGHIGKGLEIINEDRCFLLQRINQVHQS